MLDWGSASEGRQPVIRVAVIGAGQWGPNLIRNFDNRPASEVAIVVDRDERRLDQVQSRFPHCAVSGNAHDAFSDDSIAAVAIATPTVTHGALVRAALESGKHVLVEKPITNNTAEAVDLCALAERARRVLMVGHVFLYNGGTREVKKYLGEGRLGRVYYLSMVRTNLGPIRVDVNAAWDLAAHDVSMVNYWLEAEPETVSATAGGWINPRIEDAVFATLTYPGEVLVHLHTSWLSPRKIREFTIVGERSMLTFDDMNLSEPIRLYDKGVSDDRTVSAFVDSFASFRASVREGPITIPRVSLGEPLKAECDHFVDCIVNGRQPLTSGSEALAVVRVLEAIDRSAKNRGRQEAVRHD
jgi:predicted dehydrogenase